MLAYCWRAKISGMAKCVMDGCEGKPVGGVEEILDAGDHTNPKATMPGHRLAWCADHERWGRSAMSFRRWRALTTQELES
jgi:hypothetical protein